MNTIYNWSNYSRFNELNAAYTQNTDWIAPVEALDKSEKHNLDAAYLSLTGRFNRAISDMNLNYDKEEGVSCLQQAGGMVAIVSEALHKVNELSFEKNKEQTASSDKAEMTRQIYSLKNKINEVLTTASFGGKYLFSPDKDSLISIGNRNVNLPHMSLDEFGISSDEIDFEALHNGIETVDQTEQNINNLIDSIMQDYAS